MSDVIRRRADGSWGQGDVVPTYASDHAETWSGTRDKSMDHVSDEYAKYLEELKNLKATEVNADSQYLYAAWLSLQVEYNKLKKYNDGLIGVLKTILEKYSQFENAKEWECLIDAAAISFIIKTIKKVIGEESANNEKDNGQDCQ